MWKKWLEESCSYFSFIISDILKYQLTEVGPTHVLLIPFLTYVSY